MDREENITAEQDKKVIILDTSAFVAGFDPFSVNEEQYITVRVKEELTGESKTDIRLNTAIESGRLKVRCPEKHFLEAAKSTAKTTGDIAVLSAADIEVLALALQFKAEGLSPLIATDDYAIQNVAKHLGIEYIPLATFGVRTSLKWVRYCPACYRKYSSDHEAKICAICGTELKRKPIRRSKGA